MTITLTVPLLTNASTVYAPSVAAGPPQATRDRVRRRIQDLSPTNPLLVTSEGLDTAIAAALSRYSSDRPRIVVDEVTGTGSEFYALTGASPVLADWSAGFSQITAIEHPAGAVAAGYSPNWLDPTFDWTTYAAASVTYLRFISSAPAVGATARVTYTAPHVHSSSRDTVPSADLDALCDLAASYACLALATKMAASSDSLISADSTNYRDGQLRFSQQAKLWLESYEERLGITDGVAGASSTADWNRTSTFGGPFLTHSRRWGGIR